MNVFDRDGRYMFAAGSGLAAVGLDADLLIGRRLRDVFGNDAAQVEPFYDRAFGGEQVSLDLVAFGRTYRLTVAPLADPPDAIVVLAQDVTTVRVELRQHVAAEAALAQANRQKDVFFATVLHELRQPLAPLRFGFELLKRAPAANRDRLFATVERQLTQLERLLMDLTELAQEGRRPPHIRHESVDVVDVLRNVVRELEYAMRARLHTVVCQLPGPCLVRRCWAAVASLLESAGERGQVH